ncbi:MAG: hypothetical protein IID33_03550 [Planctomycetes bacterium]|nr:hypothetical protein [Planctomycetota bacterium]
MLRISLITLVALGVGLSVLAGCNDSASNRSEIQPSPARDDPSATATESKPAPDESQPADAAKPAEEPRPADAAKSAEEPRQKEPQDETAKPPPIPDYLTVLERTNDGTPVSVTGQTVGRSRLVIDTRNVKRLRINRGKLTFSAGRSIAMRLDGQVFELRARTDWVEMERSRNGEWSPVKQKP